VLDTGEVAPSFSLCDQHGEPVSLADFEDRRVVRYVYPRADTTSSPGCTNGACSFRDVRGVRGARYHGARRERRPHRGTRRVRAETRPSDRAALGRGRGGEPRVRLLRRENDVRPDVRRCLPEHARRRTGRDRRTRLQEGRAGGPRRAGTVGRRRAVGRRRSWRGVGTVGESARGGHPAVSRRRTRRRPLSNTHERTRPSKLYQRPAEPTQQ
jgi:hypothetical protein